MKQIWKIIILVVSQIAMAQDAVYEKPGIYGECIPHYISKNDSLSLYKAPNKNSILKTIPYREGWDIPYRGGVTRVISTGKLIAKKNQVLHCSPALKTGETTVRAGEEVKFLFYGGEGYGYILIKGSQCAAPVHKSYNAFELVSNPDVQVWLKVLYKDGSSPGWLFHDGSQTKVGRVTC